MGSSFELTVVVNNEDIGYINLQEAIAEVRRIEKLISSWDPDSETSEINRNAGVKPVKVSLELFKLIERSIQISEITNGSFDITIAAMEEVWKFDGSMSVFPTPEQISSAVSKVGYKKIALNKAENTVFLKEKGMKIGFGAIGKGYAADKVKELLVSKQVPAGMINASGDTVAAMMVTRLLEKKEKLQIAKWGLFGEVQKIEVEVAADGFDDDVGQI